jgi:NAD(P)H-hydrate repair Nnr-like enzyme with NAD(P)H-hydrate dehydratase domain
MRRLGRRTGWLGWVVAAGLLVSAGGAALATQTTTTTTQAPKVNADKADKARAGVLGRGGGWRHALGRRVLHGEVTLETREGVKTLVMAYGQVTALSTDAITIKSADKVETSFGIDGATRFGFRNQPAPSAELKVGEDALVAGEKSGDRATASRVVSGTWPDAPPVRPAAARMRLLRILVAVGWSDHWS